MSDPSSQKPPTYSDPVPGSPTGGPWIPVAQLLRPQGRRGELLADPLTDQANVFQAGRTFHLAKSEAVSSTAPDIALEASWRPQGRNAGRLVFKLAGIDSISAAEALEGHQLFLPAAALPALEADTYLVRDLLDCQLFDGPHLLGAIAGLEFPIAADGRTRLPDAPDLLVLQPQNASASTDPVLIPFVKAWLRSVDLNEKRIVMHLPPGLFDDTGSNGPNDPSDANDHSGPEQI